jgi:hypothetical protein
MTAFERCSPESDASHRWAAYQAVKPGPAMTAANSVPVKMSAAAK